MDEVLQFLESTFGPLVLVFTVTNLGAMGLQVRHQEVRAALRKKRSMGLIFLWGWVLGPAVAFAITELLPLAEPYVVVLYLASLAPCAPFLQQMVTKCRGDLGFAGALIPLVAIGTVVFMPLMAPFLIEGLAIDTWALAKPLLLTILLPLLIGAAVRHYADAGATKVFPAVKGIALLSMTIFMVGMGLITYCFGFGMPQRQRSVMSLGMGTRNVAAVLAAALAIPGGDPLIVVMTVMWTLWSVVLAAIAAKIFAKRAEGTAVEAAA